jgi:four helix bundle protein
MADRKKCSHEDLVAWQLADELCREIYGLMSEGSAAENLRFRSQGEEATSSTCRNLVEGYKRFNPGEFANYARYSAASNAEVGQIVEQGVVRGYWSEDRVAHARTLVKRTGGAIGGLQRYLRSSRARRNAESILRAHSEPKEPKEPKEPTEP